MTIDNLNHLHTTQYVFSFLGLHWAYKTLRKTENINAIN